MEVMVGGISAMSPYVHTSYRYMGYGRMNQTPQEIGADSGRKVGAVSGVRSADAVSGTQGRQSISAIGGAQGVQYMAFRPMRKSERLWRQDALQVREHLWSRSALCRQWKPMLRGESGI